MEQERIDFRLTITGDLAREFREYISNEYANQSGAYTFIVRKALREFLEREKVGAESNHHDQR